MLYDVFICHASEDKDALVRPLVEALKQSHVEVWYDEFELTVGDSIRRSIDRGLQQSRFGIVVLSPAFFAKNWPQYELDGLMQREMSGDNKVVLPIWHDVDHTYVLRYSAPLAARFAASSARGIDALVTELERVIRPARSPLIIARDITINWGMTPPVVTDQYWLEVVEASNRMLPVGAAIPEETIWDRWSFPLPPREKDDAESWGRRLGWTAMQMAWTTAADEIPISVVTPPDQVHAFIAEYPGLFETGVDFPHWMAQYAPQLTIRGFEGPFEDVFEESYQQSCEWYAKQRAAGSTFGSAVTTTGQVPTCEREWALRDPEFGTYDVSGLAAEYFHSDMFGPPVAYHDDGTHVFWLLSRASSWLPEHIRGLLLEGLVRCTRRWPWGNYFSTKPGEWANAGAFGDALFTAGEKGRFRWNRRAREDVFGKIAEAKNDLNLPEQLEELFNAFCEHKIVDSWIEAETELRTRRAGSRKSRHAR